MTRSIMMRKIVFTTMSFLLSIKIRMAGQHNDHNSGVWRVTWNVTGTILATAGDDGQVKLWKSDFKDQWKCMATLYGCGEGGEVPHQPKAFPRDDQFA